MCSIFGIGFFKDHKLKDTDTIIGVVSRLFREAQVNGRRASGLSIMREKFADVIRRPVSGSELINTSEYLDFMEAGLKENDPEAGRLMSIIGHCRFPTQGPESNILNNHPQVIDHIIGVHNGVITNDHALFRKFEKLFTRKAQVDTEIIFQLINHFNQSIMGKTIGAIQQASKFLNGSYACAMQNSRHPYNLYLFRNNNPIDVLLYSKLGVVLFATRESFVTRAFEEFVDAAAGQCEEVEIPARTGLVFNLWNKNMSRFDLKEAK